MIQLQSQCYDTGSEPVYEIMRTKEGVCQWLNQRIKDKSNKEETKESITSLVNTILLSE